MSSEEHWNYFGIDESLGPVAVSLRREKLEEDKEHGQQYNYRLIFRTSEVSLVRISFSADRAGWRHFQTGRHDVLLCAACEDAPRVLRD